MKTKGSNLQLTASDNNYLFVHALFLMGQLYERNRFTSGLYQKSDPLFIGLAK